MAFSCRCPHIQDNSIIVLLSSIFATDIVLTRTRIDSRRCRVLGWAASLALCFSTQSKERSDAAETLVRGEVGLGQLSDGCQVTGEALVIDPNRDAQRYVTAAEQHGFRITHATETHTHADFVYGVRALARLTGATIWLSDAGDADWKYSFAAQDAARLLRDGEGFKAGQVEITAIHTPGQTPEHLSFMLTDKAAADRAMGVFNGDFVS